MRNGIFVSIAYALSCLGWSNYLEINCFFFRFKLTCQEYTKNDTLCQIKSWQLLWCLWIYRSLSAIMAFHDNYLTFKDFNYEMVSLCNKLVLYHNWMLHYSLCQWIQKRVEKYIQQDWSKNSLSLGSYNGYSACDFCNCEPSLVVNKINWIHGCHWRSGHILYS